MNVLVVVLDSVRARNTSLHGYTHRTTPFLEELASKSVVYNNAFSPSITSLPSHLSFFTGIHENVHRIQSRNKQPQKKSYIWNTLSEKYGYQTGVFTENPQFHKPVLTKGFDHQSLHDPQPFPFPKASSPRTFNVPEDIPISDVVYKAAKSFFETRPIRTFLNGIAQYRARYSSSSDYFINEFLNWSEEVDGPWAGFINLMDAHTPYVPSDHYNKWADSGLRDIHLENGGAYFATLKNIQDSVWWHPSSFEHLYDGCIRQADSMVKMIFDKLRERGEFENTLLIVTSDHGEAFGEQSRTIPQHNLYAHTADVHEVLTHIPLIVSPPDNVAPRSVDQVVSLTQLPNVIESTVEAQFDLEQFIPDQGLAYISHGDNVGGDYKINDEYANGNREEIPKRMYAVYECDNDGKITKYCRASEYAATVKVTNAQESMKVADTEPGILDWFPTNGPTNFIGDSDRPSLSKEARARLEKFGYVQE